VAYGVSAALERGWNALVYDGPGQGQLLFVNRVLFTQRWETVVTPLVDWLLARSDVDDEPDRPDRAEHGGRPGTTGRGLREAERRPRGDAGMPGALAGLPAGDPEDPHPEQGGTNGIWNKEVAPELPAADAATLKKRFEPFSVPAMLAARQGKLFTDFSTPAKRVEA
jgi:hypothetical protein